MWKHLAVFSLSIGFLLTTGLPVLAKSDASADPQIAKPATPDIESLQLEPATLTLANPRDGRQVLVWGVTKDGRKFDLTDDATLRSESPTVIVGADRYINATGTGDATIVVSALGKQATLPVKMIGSTAAPIGFISDVMPVLAKVGCNAGMCHGSQAGKNGFKLSLRGYDPDYDYNALVNELQGRRVNRVQPDKSLMLLKSTGKVPHEGRVVFRTGDRHYSIIEQWIKEGLTIEKDHAKARPTRIEILPHAVDIDMPGRTQRVVVIAHYPDGTSRDVTREAVMSSNNEEVAKLGSNNQLTAIRRGEAAVLVRYEGNYAAVGVSVMGDRTGFAWAPMPEYNFIDKHVNAKLEQRKILPSAECTDAEFIRRVYLDLTGVVPSAAQARTFVEDKTPSVDKRKNLVNKLVGSGDYIAFWSNRWADLLQCNSKTLGEKGVWVYRDWIRQAVAQNKPYNQFAYELITAQGSSLSNPAVNYYRTLKDRDDAGKLTTNKITEDVSQTFLGVRFSCNKCHDHPFERWTQAQYYEFGAFFARVAFKPGDRGDEEIVFTSYSGGEVQHPKTRMTVAPNVPYGTSPDVEHARYRQEAFAQWMTSKDNPLFAKSYVNRVWSYFFGRGIIDPVDDIRASNPAINPALLDALSQDFVASGFDVEHLVKTIVTSRTYQLAVTPNKWNEDDKINFSHAIPRRLTAEQMMDAVSIATGTKPNVQGLPSEMRSVNLADGLMEGNDFLKLFGRPKRESACECERTSNVSLAHALNLINGPLISGTVMDPANNIAKLVKDQADNRKVIDEVYYAVLNRPASDAEATAVDLGAAGSPQRLEVAQDLAWALLTTPAFLLNRYRVKRPHVCGASPASAALVRPLHEDKEED
jgi:hypothetical protein